jgi:hypothetical protein
MIYTEDAVSHLQKLLDTVSSLPPVPVFDPSHASASYEEWHQQFHKFNDLEHEAEVIALCTVPTEVREMLDQVKAKVQERQRLDDLSKREQSSV